MEKYKRKLIPYQVYLREDQISKLRDRSHTRMASEYVRRAIDAMDDRTNDFDDGFKMGMNKAIEIIQKSRHGKIIFPHGESLGDMLVNELTGHDK